MRPTAWLAWAVVAAGVVPVACTNVHGPGSPGAPSAEHDRVAKTSAKPAARADAPPAPDANGLVTTRSGLRYRDVQVGTGETARAGDFVTVQYTGRLTNGNKFDSSVDKGEPYTFRLGVGEVVKGWDEGVAGMRAGGKRKLLVPASLGYGDHGHPPLIPPGADLNFDVELLKVVH